MAEGRVFRCDHCDNSIEAWSDGNPYYVERGRKRYAYHPDHQKLERCVGNDEPHLCLSCGEEFMVDSNAPITKCPQCSALEIISTWELAGRRCPQCKAGAFRLDPDAQMIS